MKRSEMLRKIGEIRNWDFIIIGGGATGLGTAIEAASRGYKILLLEQSDFAKGTSSRSTKLVHGGVRDYKAGQVSQLGPGNIYDDPLFLAPAFGKSGNYHVKTNSPVVDKGME